MIVDVAALLTPERAAAELGVSAEWMRRMLAAGKIEKIMLPSGRVRVPLEAIEKLRSEPR
jgi:excisionase family DNA binding protein